MADVCRNRILCSEGGDSNSSGVSTIFIHCVQGGSVRYAFASKPEVKHGASAVSLKHHETRVIVECPAKTSRISY